jgi:hypothetical protein
MNAPDLVKETEPGVFEFRVRLTTDLAKAALPAFLENLRTLDRKQQDYGSGNLTKFGVEGVVIRANDKLERIINLRKKGVTGGSPANESLADSFLDLANYALIGFLMQTAKWPVTTVPAPEASTKDWPKL